MKLISLMFFVLGLFFSLSSKAQSDGPKDPLLKDVSQCFRTLRAVPKKSNLQFYSEITKSSPLPNCQPNMLVHKDLTHRIPKLSIYRDDVHGKIQGLTIDVKDKSGKYSMILPGTPVVYPCARVDEQQIAQYGKEGKPQELIVDFATHPPRLLDEKPVGLLTVPAKVGHDERTLRQQVRREIAVRVKGGEQPSRGASRADLMACYKLLERRAEEQDSKYSAVSTVKDVISEDANDQEVEEALKILAGWTSKGGEPSTPRDSKAVRD